MTVARFKPKTRDELNAKLAKSRDLSECGTWDTSLITDMSFLIDSMQVHSNPHFEGLKEWDMSNVTTMRGMFDACEFLTTIDCSSWDVTNVVDMRDMFKECKRLTHVTGLNEWVLTSVTKMQRMFDGCIAFNQPLQNWNLTPPRHVAGLFRGCLRLQLINFPLMNPWWLLLSGIYPQMTIKNRVATTGTPLFLSITAFEERVLFWQSLVPSDMEHWFSTNTPPARFIDNPAVFHSRVHNVVLFLTDRSVDTLTCQKECRIVTSKQWRPLAAASLLDDSTIRTCLDATEADEEAAFQTFMSTQSLVRDGNVIVAALTHGAYLNCTDTTAQCGRTSNSALGTRVSLPLFTIPDGKSLMILSVATPSAVEWNAPSLIKMGIMRHIKERVSSDASCGFGASDGFSLNGSPVEFMKEIQDKCTTEKRCWKEQLETGFRSDPYFLQNKTKQNELQEARRFIQTYREPRVLYFKAGDNCPDKTFFIGGKTHNTLVEITPHGANKAVNPPKGNQLTLGQLCALLFSHGRQNIFLIDWSCSVLFDLNNQCLPTPTQNLIGAMCIANRMGGGGYRPKHTSYDAMH